MTPETRLKVLLRDQGCVAVLLDPSEYPYCQGRLTLDHVKDQPRLSKRATSDEFHLVSLCEYHHTGAKAGRNWATSHRPDLRHYLQWHYGDDGAGGDHVHD